MFERGERCKGAGMIIDARGFRGTSDPTQTFLDATLMEKMKMMIA
jgi:hypothetical protein